MTTHRGPLDDVEWPKKLPAHVVTAGPAPRVHGYDVENDLARHYSFSDAIYLSLVGELPNDATSRAFEIALHFLAPVSAAEAPSHAAILARFCDGSTS